MKKNGVKIIIIGIILAVLVIGYFYYIANKVEESQKKEEVAESTLVQSVLLRDLDKNYPPSPKEVVKYFSEISRCFYNEKYTEDELYELAMKIEGIYDDELLANQTQEQYLTDLKSDIAEMKANDRSISSYDVSLSTDVEFFYEGEDYCARLYCTYNIRQKTEILQSRVVFILRQDENKHWKILGWELDN